MTTKITPEAVKERIAALESAGELSLKEQFYLEALRQLVAAMDSEPVAWLLSGGGAKNVVCFDSGNAYADPLREVTPLYRHAHPSPVVQCPFPCGWDNLNKLAIQDAALVARGLVEGELTTEAHRQAAISNNDRLLKVISACRAAMLHAGNSPVIPDSSVIGWIRYDYQESIKKVGGPLFILGANDPSDAWGLKYMPVAKAGEQQNAPQNIPEIIPDSCTWTFSNYDDHWSGTCGAEWVFNDGGPEENGVKFCPKCGKSVAVSSTEGTEE